MNCRPITKSQSADGLPPLRPIDLMVGALDPTFFCAYPYCSTPHDMIETAIIAKSVAQMD